MKTLLEEDEENISSLRKMIHRLETERTNLGNQLKKVSTERDEALAKDGLQYSLHLDPDELMKKIKMPTDLGDSLIYLGEDMDRSERHSMDRRLSILALEELEMDLKNLLNGSSGSFRSCFHHMAFHHC